MLELLVSNGGKPLTPLYSDSKLIERLRVMISDDNVVPRVRKKLIAMVIGWNGEFAGDAKYSSLTGLNKFAKQYYKPGHGTNTNDHNATYSSSSRVHGNRRDREVPQFMDDTADDFTADEIRSIADVSDRSAGHFRSSSGSNRDLDQAYEIPKIDIRKAAPEINRILSEATASATILRNELESLNRKRGELAIDNDRCTINFDKCRQIRRKVLRYLQLISEGQFLGLLIHANDELVEALQKYSDYSKPMSDSEIESSKNSNTASRVNRSGFISESEDEEESLATGAVSRRSDDYSFNTNTNNNYESEDDDEANPFADRNKVVE